MFLAAAKLENVRSIEALEMSFLRPDDSVRPWTLLLGENGAGKSSFLRSIALALGGSNALPELLKDSEHWIRRCSQVARITLTLRTAEGEPRVVSLELERGLSLSRVFERNRASLELLDNAIEHTQRNYFTIGYGVWRRQGVGRGFENRRAQCVATLFSSDAPLQSVEQWAMDLDYRSPRKAKEVLRNTFAGLLPGIDFERIDKQKRRLMFSTPDGALPLGELSEGYQNIISWCGDLLFRVTNVFADHKNPLHARGLLLIDEVDLHLHPIWQRKLIDFLQEKLPHFQVVVTTHSPLTAHQAGEDELFLLKRPTEKDPPVLEPFPGDPRKLLVHQFLMSPAFGLNTIESRHMELLKRKYDELSGVRGKSAGEKKKLAAVKEELADAPRWELNTAQAKKRLSLLAEIRSELKKA
jgi:predicted ATP-binding protein involved in virulence